MPDTTAPDVNRAPHRQLSRSWMLMAALVAPPVAWALHLMVNYAVSSHACFPSVHPRTVPLPAFSWFRLLLIAMDLGAITIACIAILIAYRSLRQRSAGATDAPPPLADTERSRVRFLAIWGVLVGAVFFLATVFDFAGLWILPKC